MDVYSLILLFINGTIFGSFFNVAGLRIPQNIPFHYDRSYCPSCKNQLRSFELIPILSYLLQGGKCRTCRSRISPIYPLIEFFTGILFVYCYIKLGFTFELVTSLLLVSMLMIIFVSDISYMIIPNKVLWFFFPFFIFMRIISPLDPWYDAAIGAISGFSLIAIIIIVSQGGMGAGDMKLFGVLGVVLGFSKILLTFFLAAFLGSVVGGILMLFQKVKRKQPIPFGPYIVIATMISYYYGEQIISFYFHLFN